MADQAATGGLEGRAWLWSPIGRFGWRARSVSCARQWPEELTQAQLATAFSTESKVASATVSSWESTTNPKTPTAARLRAYARFFATRRSMEGGPHLIPANELSPDERDRFHELEDHCSACCTPTNTERPSTFTFDDGPVTVICPEAPGASQGPLAREKDPNFAKLQRYADLDALIEIYGHFVRPTPTWTSSTGWRTEVVADDFSTHVILLGGIAWNTATRRFQTALSQIPITQVEDPTVPTGDIFELRDGGKKFLPLYDDPADRGEEGKPELIEDVAFLARIQNPFKISRTLTICNGIHSRGVLGAVRCLTDAQMRDANERYLAERFPDGQFAMLLRVPVVANEALSPDLQNPEARLFEWAPNEKGRP